MSYVLLKAIHPSGRYGEYAIVSASNDIYEIGKEMQKRILDGSPARDYRVMQEVPFEFKCGVKFNVDLFEEDSE